MPYLGVRPADITSATEAEIAGDLTVDTNTLKVDATNNRVGIGTLSPDRSLHITSSEPSVVLENSGQGTDLKTWRMYSNSSSLQIGTVDDAFAAGQNALEITRDNTDNITGIQFKTGASSEIGRFTTSGLTFNGDTAAANALDDYETGSVTLSYVADTNPTVNYAIREAEYVKIGDFVYIAGRLRTNTVTVGSGTLRIGGLPFTVASGQIWGVVNLGYIVSWPADNFPSTGYAQPGQTTCDLIKYNTDDPRDERGAAVSAASMTTSSAGNDIIFNITYKTA